MASDTYHEPHELLTEPTKDLHRAIVSLMEELEAIDWYQQRADACADSELRAVLIHNKNEEIEHAMMVLEWIRRQSAEFDAHARTYLFTKEPITQVEKDETAAQEAGSPALSSAPPGVSAALNAAPNGTLGIGSLKG